jgi:hypothetical protein
MEIKSDLNRFMKEVTGSFQDDFLDKDGNQLLFNHFKNLNNIDSKWIHIEKKNNQIKLSVVLSLGECQFFSIFINDLQHDIRCKLVIFS